MCAGAADCVAVSSTCCQCPSFAVAAGLGYDDGCSQIECEDEIECPDVEAACIDSQCRLICSAVPTVKVCANGFARDDFGCLLDACREDPPGEVFACSGDGDCTQVQADCCGCELGGADTAVAAAFVDEYLDSLGCGSDAPCPGVDVCDSSLVPRCIAQSCTLGPPAGGGSDDGGDGESPGEGDLCGVPDIATCPPGQACILNHPDAGDATQIGVGTCRDE